MTRDLQPYSCTFESCPDRGRTYKSRTAWITHELFNHRASSEWICIEVCGRKFADRGYFKAHILDDHLKATRSDSCINVDDIISQREQKTIPYPPPQISCLFCKESIQGTRAALHSHIGRHFDEIALTALPMQWNDEEEDDSDGDFDVENQKVDSFAHSTGGPIDSVHGHSEKSQPASLSQHSEPKPTMSPHSHSQSKSTHPEKPKQGQMNVEGILEKIDRMHLSKLEDIPAKIPGILPDDSELGMSPQADEISDGNDQSLGDYKQSKPVVAIPSSDPVPFSTQSHSPPGPLSEGSIDISDFSVDTPRLAVGNMASQVSSPGPDTLATSNVTAEGHPEVMPEGIKTTS